MKVSAILLAAGQGKRYNGPKQDVIFHGKPIWKFTYDTLSKVIDKNNIIVVGKDIEGGATRTKSVKIGLSVLDKDTEKVVIVEAARPMVTKNQIYILANDIDKSTAFVRPLVNTVVYRKGEYIERNELYELLTPQSFDYKLLCEAYSNGRFEDTTDETVVMYKFHNIKAHFIETSNNLYKITYPGDLDILESIYKSNPEEYE